MAATKQFSHWTPERIALLETHWMAGDTATQVKDKILAATGHEFTRNSVIGKAARMGLSADLRSQKRVAGKRRRWSYKGLAERPPAICPLPPCPDHHHCQYPSGDTDKGDFKYCGDPVQEGSSYCGTHHRLCYRAEEPSRTERHARRQMLFRNTMASSDDIPENHKADAEESLAVERA